MSVLNRNFLYNLKCNTIFVAMYSLIFILVYKTFPYIAPFLIGGIIAIIINPISQKLKDKLRIDKGISTLALSFIAVAIVIAFGTFIVISGSRALMEIIDKLAQDPEHLNSMIMTFIDKANVYFKQFQDLAKFDLQELATKYSGQIINLAKDLLRSLINLAGSIPYIALFTITLFISTYFIAKDIDKIENGFYSMFTDSTKVKVRNIKREATLSVIGYIRAYTILMGITFLVIWGSFSLFGVPYGFILGFIGAILDLIPFLGITVIYIPVIIYYIIVKNYFVAISIGIVFVSLSLLRQILEPKLVSANIGLSPLATLAAIFIGIQVKGLVGIIFFLGIVVMHQILKKVDIL